MSESAYEWGVRHGSCPEALEMRRGYASQADWWRACPRGDWLLWQLGKLPDETQRRLHPKVERAIEVVVTSAIVEHALDCGVPAVEEWAARWLSGEDRSARAAEAASWAAASWAARWLSGEDRSARAEAASWAATAAASWAATARAAAASAAAADAADAAERQRQADDIRAEIPEWPGEEEK